MGTMGDIPTVIDQAYLVSVQELREICEELSCDRYEYRLFRADETQVRIRYSDDVISDFFNLNAVCFLFPIVADMWPLGLLQRNAEEGMMVCLHVYTGRQTRHSFHLD